MKRIRIIIAAAIAAALIVLGGASAQAATDRLGCHSYGGWIWNDGRSRLLPRIYAGGPGTGCGKYYNLGKGEWSKNFYDFRDVDAFYVGPGYYCESQWGYRYYGNVNGTWFWLANDGVQLTLLCVASADGRAPAVDGGTTSPEQNGDPSEATVGVAPPGA